MWKMLMIITCIIACEALFALFDVYDKAISINVNAKNRLTMLSNHQKTTKLIRSMIISCVFSQS